MPTSVSDGKNTAHHLKRRLVTSALTDPDSLVKSPRIVKKHPDGITASN